MRRLVPTSVAGRLIALLLVALITSQLASFIVFVFERRSSRLAFQQDGLVARTVVMTQLLADTPSDLHDRVLASSNSRGYRHWLTRDSMVRVSDTGEVAEEITSRLTGLIGSEVRSIRTASPGPWPAGRAAPLVRRALREDDSDFVEERRPRRGPLRSFATVSVQLPSGQWLNVASRRPRFAWRWTSPWFYSLAFMAIASALVVVVVVRKITRPMAQLADAADRLGRGESVDPLVEDGPDEVKRTTRAFNQMRERLLRFVNDRTRMLAAISHDLRTPITTLRLRAEMLEDLEERDRILATLDEMHDMAEAALAFAREESASENTRTVDLAALVSSVCDDLADIGLEVSCADAEKTECRCRPLACKRALRNVIENAVRYGSRARVSLETGANQVTVVVDDDGPGIAPDRMEDVFSPFVRLEESRSKETGGVGLGLAIARSIIRGHGGDIVLINRSQGGLRAAIRLPTAGPAGT